MATATDFDGDWDQGFQISDFKLQTSDFRLQISDFRLQISDFRTEAHSGPGVRVVLRCVRVVLRRVRVSLRRGRVASWWIRDYSSAPAWPRRLDARRRRCAVWSRSVGAWLRSSGADRGCRSSEDCPPRLESGGSTTPQEISDLKSTGPPAGRFTDCFSVRASGPPVVRVLNGSVERPDRRARPPRSAILSAK